MSSASRSGASPRATKPPATGGGTSPARTALSHSQVSRAVSASGRSCSPGGARTGVRERVEDAVVGLVRQPQRQLVNGSTPAASRCSSLTQTGVASLPVPSLAGRDQLAEGRRRAADVEDPRRLPSHQRERERREVASVDELHGRDRRARARAPRRRARRARPTTGSDWWGRRARPRCPGAGSARGRGTRARPPARRRP